MRKRRLDPRVHVPGRIVRHLFDIPEATATILYATREECVIYKHMGGLFIRVPKMHASHIIMRGGVIPRRCRRASDGNWTVYLGRDHPLSNSGGYQYERRLVAMGKYRRLSPPVTFTRDRDKSRHPGMLSEDRASISQPHSESV